MATLRQKVNNQLNEYKEKIIKDKKTKMIQDKAAYKKLASTGIKDSEPAGGEGE